MVKGDFLEPTGPEIGTDALGRSIRSVSDFTIQLSTRTVNGQLVRDPFVGNIIPANRWDPAAAKILSLYPAANQAITPDVSRTTISFPRPVTRSPIQAMCDVDYKLTDKDSIFGSLSWSNNSKVNAPPFPGALDGSPFNAVTEEDLGRNAQT